ncbi:MAG: 4Fe-4S ferredoxin, partial [Planctomycetales bacterium]|nr:4Fe-4S ferredoxin [Planctomycetales bacterium]
IPWSKRWSMSLASWAMQSATRFNWLGGLARTALRWLPRFFIYNPLNAWGRHRELPPAPTTTFRQQYAQRKRQQTKSS